MISYIDGEVLKCNTPFALVVNNGVGYSIMTNELLSEGDAVKLFIEPIIREDSITLIGFASYNTQLIFRSLLSVSGIGPSKALSILKVVPESILVKSISYKDKSTLLSYKGISDKLASNIVASVRIPDSISTAMQDSQDLNSSDEHLAVQTLVSLGFSEDKARKAVLESTTVLSSNSPDRLSELVSSSLGRL